MTYRLHFQAMGTEMLLCVDSTSENPSAEMAQVPRWFEEWEQILSRFRFDSELSYMNQRNGEPVAVSETLWDVFQTSIHAEIRTAGLVTPTVANAVVNLGYDRDFAEIAGQSLQPIDASHPAPPLDLVNWDENTRTIYLPENTSLDFGGIAKGWAAMQVVKRLEHLGTVLMNCGGDIAVSGALLNGTHWEIGVFKPHDRLSGYAEMLYIDHACGIATSARDRRRWLQGDTLHHHIINPWTGLPVVSDVMSSTVIAPTAIEAEAAAKAVLIQGSEAGLAWVEEDPALSALLILENGQILYSHSMEQYTGG